MIRHNFKSTEETKKQYEYRFNIIKKTFFHNSDSLMNQYIQFPDRMYKIMSTQSPSTMKDGKLIKPQTLALNLISLYFVTNNEEYFYLFRKIKNKINKEKKNFNYNVAPGEFNKIKDRAKDIISVFNKDKNYYNRIMALIAALYGFIQNLPPRRLDYYNVEIYKDDNTAKNESNKRRVSTYSYYTGKFYPYNFKTQKNPSYRNYGEGYQMPDTLRSLVSPHQKYLLYEVVRGDIDLRKPIKREILQNFIVRLLERKVNDLRKIFITDYVDKLSNREQEEITKFMGHSMRTREESYNQNGYDEDESYDNDMDFLIDEMERDDEEERKYNDDMDYLIDRLEDDEYQNEDNYENNEPFNELDRDNEDYYDEDDDPVIINSRGGIGRPIRRTIGQREYNFLSKNKIRNQQTRSEFNKDPVEYLQGNRKRKLGKRELSYVLKNKVEKKKKKK